MDPARTPSGRHDQEVDVAASGQRDLRHAYIGPCDSPDVNGYRGFVHLVDEIFTKRWRAVVSDRFDGHAVAGADAVDSLRHMGFGHLCPVGAHRAATSANITPINIAHLSR